MITHIKAVKNQALVIVLPAYDGEWSSQYVTAPAGLDSEVSADKGAFADCTNELTEVGSSGVCTLDLTAGEMNADLIAVKFTSTTTGVNFPLVVIHTYTEPLTAARTELASIPTRESGVLTKIDAIFAYILKKKDVNRTTGKETMYKADGSTPLGQASAADDGTTFTRDDIV